MRITVTQDDIDRGRPGDRYYCPLAYALHRRLTKKGAVLEVMVNISTARARSRDRRVGLWRLDRKAVDWVVAFDQRKPVEPATFTMRAISA